MRDECIEEFDSLIASEGSYHFSDDVRIKSINHLINIIFREDDKELIVLLVADVIKYLNEAVSESNDDSFTEDEISDIKFITKKYIANAQPYWDSISKQAEMLRPSA